MPAASAQYTLVGFSPELDWRALKFVKPLPPHRVCGACGLVRNRTALLPCTHVLCECCYEQCGRDGSHACPLDGNHYEEEDVALMDFPAEELLRREVKCWNETSGCQYAAAASGIIQHFLRECGHHTVCCPKCYATVNCGSIIAHLKSDSCNTAVSLEAEYNAQAGFKDERAFITFLDGAFEKQASEIRNSLERMAADITTHGDRLNEICEGIDVLKEAARKEPVVGTSESEKGVRKSGKEVVSSSEEVRECLATPRNAIDSMSESMDLLEKTLKQELNETRDSLLQITAAIGQVEHEVKENSEKTLDSVNSILRLAKLQAARCDFFVPGVSSLREKAISSGLAVYYSEKVCLRGYCISPGVRFDKDGSSVKIKACFCLHKGEMDDVIQWPFEHTIRSVVMHPEDGAERVKEFKPHRDVGANQRPAASSNKPGYFFTEWLSVSDLISGGYVHGDQLRIKWELLP